MWPFKKKCEHEWRLIAVQSYNVGTIFDRPGGGTPYTKAFYRCNVCDEQVERWHLGVMKFSEMQLLYPKPLGRRTGKPF